MQPPTTTTTTMMTSSRPLCYKGLLFAVGGLATASLIQTITLRQAEHSAEVIQRFWRRRGPSSSTRAVIEHFKHTRLSAETRISNPEQFRRFIDNPWVIRVTGRLVRRLMALTGGVAAVKDPVFRRLIERQLAQRQRLFLSAYVALLHPQSMFAEKGPLEDDVAKAASLLVRYFDGVVCGFGGNNDPARVKELSSLFPVLYGKFLEMHESWMRAQAQYHIERLKRSIFELRLGMLQEPLTVDELVWGRSQLYELSRRLIPLIGDAESARFQETLLDRLKAYHWHPSPV